MESYQTRVLGGFDCMVGRRHGILATIAFSSFIRSRWINLTGAQFQFEHANDNEAMQRWCWNCCSITGGSAAEHAAGGEERRDAHEGKEGEREGEGMGGTTCRESQRCTVRRHLKGPRLLRFNKTLRSHCVGSNLKHGEQMNCLVT